MQMVGGIVKEGVILANEFASNNERRWFGLHYHGSFLIHYLLPIKKRRFLLRGFLSGLHLDDFVSLMRRHKQRKRKKTFDFITHTKNYGMFFSFSRLFFQRMGSAALLASWGDSAIMKELLLFYSEFLLIYKNVELGVREILLEGRR